MSVTTYVGAPGITFDVESLDEVTAVIDALHTQVIDNLGGDPRTLAILEAAMDALYKAASDPPADKGLTWAERAHGIDGL